MRLCAALRSLLGGSKYVKQSELSREVLLSYAIQKRDVVPVTLFTVVNSRAPAEVSLGYRNKLSNLATSI